MKKLYLSMRLFFVSMFLSSIALSAQDFQSVMTVFAHGATARPSQIKHFKQAFIDAQDCIAVEFPDVKDEDGSNLRNSLIAFLSKNGWNRHIVPSHSFFGQGQDVEKMHQDIMEQAPADKSLALFGLCRGGIAAINYLARYNDENVQALVVEGVPYDVLEMYYTRLAVYGIFPIVSETIFKTLWSSYPHNSINRVQAIKNITNKNLPILILHAQCDECFSLSHALRMYKDFKQEGFKNVHLAVVQGRHALSLKDDQDNYLRAVHSFYKHYGLQHDARYATDDMESYSYDLDQAEQKIDQQKETLEKLIYEKQMKIAQYAVTFASCLVPGVIFFKNICSF